MIGFDCIWCVDASSRGIRGAGNEMPLSARRRPPRAGGPERTQVLGVIGASFLVLVNIRGFILRSERGGRGARGERGGSVPRCGNTRIACVARRRPSRVTRQQQRIIVWDCGGRRGRNEPALPKGKHFEISEMPEFPPGPHTTCGTPVLPSHVPEDQRLG